ncbi:hypothetical protein BC830DRAFT_1168818 [Chytriomyces sp. MP71]|nr:hypothetical protein BC830DRAFT_1168818 [Chytriomyces sp. MP71]
MYCALPEKVHSWCETAMASPATAASRPFPLSTTTHLSTQPPLSPSLSTSSPLESQGGHQPLFGYESSSVIESRASNSSSVLADFALAADFELFGSDITEVESLEEGMEVGGPQQSQLEMEGFQGSELLHFLESTPVSGAATPQFADSEAQSFEVEAACKEAPGLCLFDNLLLCPRLTDTALNELFATSLAFPTLLHPSFHSSSVSNATSSDILANLNAIRPGRSSSEAPLLLPASADAQLASLAQSPGMLAVYESLLADPYLSVPLFPQSLDTTTLLGRHDHMQQEPKSSPTAQEPPVQNEDDPFAFLDCIIAPPTADAPISPALSLLQTFEITTSSPAFPDSSAACNSITSTSIARSRRPRISVKRFNKAPPTIKRGTPKPMIPAQLVHTPNDILSLSKDPQCNEYVCPWPRCGQRASRRYNLKVHYMTHLPIGMPSEEIESHACGVCGKVFRRRFDVARHLKSLHRGEEEAAFFGESVFDRRRKSRAILEGIDLGARVCVGEEVMAETDAGNSRKRVRRI